MPLAVSFLCHFPSAFAAWVFPSVLPFGVRTFLARLLAKPPAITRPAYSIVASNRLVLRRSWFRTPGTRSHLGGGRTLRRRGIRGSPRASVRRAPGRACG